MVVIARSKILRLSLRWAKLRSNLKTGSEQAPQSDREAVILRAMPVGDPLWRKGSQ